MPFFEGAQHFIIKHAEMNDVAGDYNKTETTTTTTNSDVGNRYIMSAVSKGNTKTDTAIIRGNNNVISVRGEHRVNGNMQSSDLPQLQNALQALPGLTLPGISSIQDPRVQAQVSTAIQDALQSLSVVGSNGTSAPTVAKPILASSTSPNATSLTSAVTEPPSLAADGTASPNATPTPAITESSSVGGTSSDGTVTNAVPATRAAGTPAAPLVNESLPKESSPPRVETALVVPPPATAEVGTENAVRSATVKTNMPTNVNEELQASPIPATKQQKRRKGIIARFTSLFRKTPVS